jgi:hypothetical protein
MVKKDKNKGIVEWGLWGDDKRIENWKVKNSF